MKIGSNMEKISVIIPIYNVEQYLEKCIQSVLNQSYSNIEVLLINDGSTDKCPQICDELAKKDSRIRVIHKKNGGVSDARNVGINQAKGLYLTFVDPDDLIAIDMIELLHGTLLSNQCDISACGILRFNENEQPSNDLNQNVVRAMTSDDAINDMLYQNKIVIAILGKLYRKDLLKSVKFSKDITIAEDADFNYRIFSQATSIVVNSSQKYYYLQRKGSAIHSSFSTKRMDGLVVMKNILKDAAKHRQPVVESAKSRLFIEAIYIATEISYSSRRYKSESDECLGLIKTLGRDLVNNEKSRKRYRQYAAIALFSPRLLISLLKFKILLERVRLNIS